MLRYDVVVIGAGPAGSCSAYAAAKSGAKTLVVERKRAIGSPVQCAEMIPAMLVRELNLDNSAFSQKTKGIKTIFPSGKVTRKAAPGIMIHRWIFDRQLACRAMTAGAEFRLQTTACSVDGATVSLKSAGEKLTVEAKVIIAADGPSSFVNQMLNKKHRCILALQWQVPLLKPYFWTDVYFKSSLPGGYAWLFPKDTMANIGAGMTNSNTSSSFSNLRKILHAFALERAASGQIIPQPIAETSGLIPCGGPSKHTVLNNIILVGDAAGQSHPLTGGGVPQAALCGLIAGKAAANAALSNDESKLKDYEIEWKQRWNMELQHALEKRNLLTKHWNALDDMLESCWVTSDKYYEKP